MNEIPLGVLVGLLIGLIASSAFFSSSETGLMSLNRYRLRHLARTGHRGAQLAQRLLGRTDRLIGLILLGNNFVNILASAIATVVFMRLMGEAGIAVATVVLTLVILIFAEVTPKTVAALHPERVAFPAAYVYTPLLKVLYPVVWVVNYMANGLLHVLGISVHGSSHTTLSREELRTVVIEAGAMIPKRHQQMLLSILDLEKVTVEDIMVPRNEIVGIDLDDDWERIREQLFASPYTRLPVFRGTVDNLQGILHVRRVLPWINQDRFDRSKLEGVISEPYFVPENASLNQQLLNFQRERQRLGFVVDEYGDIQGLITLEDLLEEIVGEFTTDSPSSTKHIHAQKDGCYLVDGGAHVREINRALNAELPTEGPRTINGLILEHLEMIPEPGTSLLIAGYPVEIIKTQDNAVRKVRICPNLRRPVNPAEGP